MRYIITLSLVCLFSFSSTAQKKIKKELDSITTTQHAEVFLETHKNKKNKLITFNEEKHKTRLAKELFDIRQGGSKVIKNEIEKIHYKVIEKNKIPHFRVSFIYLDGSKLSMLEIESMRNKIIAQYNNGVPFTRLAKTYSMDRSAKQGGDLGWFTHGDMVPEFESAVVDTSHGVDDVFTVDIPEKQWYYVVLKTHDSKDITEIKVLKVVESEER